MALTQITSFFGFSSSKATQRPETSKVPSPASAGASQTVPSSGPSDQVTLSSEARDPLTQRLLDVREKQQNAGSLKERRALDLERSKLVHQKLQELIKG